MVMPMNFSHVESVPEPACGRYTLIAPALPPTCLQLVSLQVKTALSCARVSDAGASVPPLAADRAAQVIASLANATKTTPPGLSPGLVGLRPPEERAKSRQA